MKTIKQIADEIGVTKSALQKRISRGSLYTRLYPYIVMKSGTKYIDGTGENIIKEVFGEKPAGIPVHTPSIDVYTRAEKGIDTMLVELLREQMEDLRQQLAVKDKQIEELTLTVRVQAESINAANKNELAETIIDGREKLLSPPAPEKFSLWSKIFRKKKE
jgi:hypothetical protein